GESAGDETVIDGGGDSSGRSGTSGDPCAAAARAAGKPPSERQSPEYCCSMIGRIANASMLEISSRGLTCLWPMEPVTRCIDRLERVLALQPREQPESANDSEISHSAGSRR